MSQPRFLRYYVRNAEYQNWQRLVAAVHELDGWGVHRPSDFHYQSSHGYDETFQGADIKLVEGQLHQLLIWGPGVVLEHHNPDLGSSLLFPGTEVATTLDDVLTLVSIGLGYHVQASMFEYRNGGSFTRGLRPTTRMDSDFDQAILHNEMADFVRAALSVFAQAGRKENMGFVPAVYWHRQAQRAFTTSSTAVEMGLYWVTLEVIGRTRRVKWRDRRLVENVAESLGFTGSDWDFLDAAMSDWYAIRNVTFHGQEQPKWFTDSSSYLKRRRRQLGDFVNLVLTHLIDGKGLTRRARLRTVFG